LTILVVGLALVAGFCATTARAQDEEPRFLRGDANLDGRVSLSDVFCVLRFMGEGTQLRCKDAADADDDGAITQIDVFALLGAIFYRHSPPPSPFPKTGSDPTADLLGCRQGLAPALARGVDAALDAADGPARDEPAGVAGSACEDEGGGAEIDFLHFRGEILAVPGQTGIRVPVYLTSMGEIEGMTLSFYAAPDRIRFDSIDYSDSYLGDWDLSPEWTYGFTAKRDQGYIAGTMAMSLGSEIVTMPPVQGGLIAVLEFSVLPGAPVGSRANILFRTTPGDNGVLPIENEISRRGSAQSQFVCGLSVEIVDGREVFLRGDANRDRNLNIGDVISIVLHLFSPAGRETKVPCLDAADADDNGEVEITDAILVARYLFGRGIPPAAPFPNAGRDWSDDDPLGCGAP
jgi:hypothetical protein